MHLVAVEAAHKASLNSLFIKYKTEARNRFYRNLTAVEAVLSFIRVYSAKSLSKMIRMTLKIASTE